MPAKTRSLTRPEARVVLSLEAEGCDQVTLPEVQRRAEVSRAFARKIAHDLARKGWLQRIRRGRYLVNPPNRGPEGVPDLDPLRVAVRLVEPYYLGYATAAELQGLLSQAGSTYYVATPNRVTRTATGPYRFQFVRTPRDRWFGTKELVRRGERLRVSDPERTVVDAFDRPELVGGLAGAVSILAHAKPHLRWDRLDRYLRRIHNESLGRRVGYVAERVRPALKVPEDFRRARRPPAHAPFVPLGPPVRYGRAGKRDPVWRIIRNVPERELWGEVDVR
jgi:predicted transcriptional regulator of viral defense system